MNKKLLAICATLTILMSVMPAYGLHIYPPPKASTFDGEGFTYTVPFFVSFAEQPQIFVHNNWRYDQFVYIKVLLVSRDMSEWLASSLEPYRLYRFVIPADAVLKINSGDMGLSQDIPPNLLGVVVISHPNRNYPATPLDVTYVNYHYLNEGAQIESADSVVYVPGVKVSNVPTPCVIPMGTRICQLLPL